MTPCVHTPDIPPVPGAQVVEATARAVKSGRNVLVAAPPGIGPTMLARRILQARCGRLAHKGCA